MAAFYDETHHLVISDDEARGAVTGHNVRYVLALSLTGVIAAFAAIAVYWGYDSLQQSLAAAFARSPAEIVRSLAPYAAIVLAGAIIGGLVLSLWNTIAGRSEDESESFMRARVATQFALICVIMALLYVSTA
jgi:TRAP-type C4-dicarboxylate transport system permease small subunit